MELLNKVHLMDPTTRTTTVFFHLILIMQFSNAKLVLISVHAHTHARTQARCVRMLIFICENERLWQSTLKLITLCLQQLLNSDKCLKQRDYISRSYPSLDKE